MKKKIETVQINKCEITWVESKNHMIGSTETETTFDKVQHNSY